MPFSHSVEGHFKTLFPKQKSFESWRLANAGQVLKCALVDSGSNQPVEHSLL